MYMCFRVAFLTQAKMLGFEKNPIKFIFVGKVLKPAIQISHQ